MVKNLPVMQETWVQSLGQEDPLEKGMATLSSILAWRIPWTEETGGLPSMGLHRVGQDRRDLAAALNPSCSWPWLCGTAVPADGCHHKLQTLVHQIFWVQNPLTHLPVSFTRVLF